MIVLRCRQCGEPPTGSPTSVERQRETGDCDRCQRARWVAARNYIRACEEGRLLPWVTHGMTPSRAAMCRHAVAERIQWAERQCVAMGLWTAGRPQQHPERFRAKGKR